MFASLSIGREHSPVKEAALTHRILGDGCMPRRVYDLVIVLLWLGFVAALVFDPWEPWPFSTWPMFRHARGPGWDIHRLSVQAIDEEGQLHPELQPRGWRRQALDAMFENPELRPELLRTLATSWADSRPDEAARLVRLELVEERYRFSPAPILEDRVIIAAVDL